MNFFISELFKINILKNSNNDVYYPISQAVWIFHIWIFQLNTNDFSLTTWGTSLTTWGGSEEWINMGKFTKMNPWRLQGLTEPIMTQETQHQAADMWSDEEDPFWEEEAEAITSEFAEMMKAPWLVPILPPQPWEEVPNEPATFPPWMFALHQMDEQMIGWMKAANADAKSNHWKKQSTPTTST